jgi:hypothetical protein
MPASANGTHRLGSAYEIGDLLVAGAAGRPPQNAPRHSSSEVPSNAGLTAVIWARVLGEAAP